MIYNQTTIKCPMRIKKKYVAEEKNTKNLKNKTLENNQDIETQEKVLDTEDEKNKITEVDNVLNKTEEKEKRNIEMKLKLHLA